MIFSTYRNKLQNSYVIKKSDFRIIMYYLINNICGNEILKSVFSQNRGKF